MTARWVWRSRASPRSAQDNEGHVYAVSLDGPVYRLVQ